MSEHRNDLTCDEVEDQLEEYAAIHVSLSKTLNARDADIAQLRAERDALREALRRLHDAVWEYDGPASEEMDAAAGEALAVLGDVISLAPVAEEETT